MIHTNVQIKITGVGGGGSTHLDRCLLCQTIQSHSWFPKLQMNTLLLYPEDTDILFLRNTGNHL